MNTPRRFAWLLGLLTPLLLAGCGYNDFQRLDEQVKAAWAEVLNQYQRRADLIPNIVSTVKGEANFEQETLTQVIEARAKATSIQATGGRKPEACALRGQPGDRSMPPPTPRKFLNGSVVLGRCQA